MKLDDLAKKYNTDKSSLSHGYCPFYEKHLPPRDAQIKLLEIGVKEGASLKMWTEWFPNAQIHGLDLFEENTRAVVWEEMNLNYDHLGRIFLHKGNQVDWQVLEELRKHEFDIIIDDGSHNARDQMITFFGLFNGKQYYIEDTHCNYDPYFSQGLPFNMTATAWFGSMENVRRDLSIDFATNIIHVRCY